MSAPSISKIHVTNSTGLSLNERFTAIASQPRTEPIMKRRRSRSASRGRNGVAAVVPVASPANRRLLQQLARREKMQAALKLKRRSLKAIGGRAPIKRGSIRTLRVAPNGRPIKANSLTKVATMKADLIGVASSSRRPLRRSSSIANRLGGQRTELGGAAQRVARRQLDRGRRRLPAVAAPGGRSRSRSRARVPTDAILNTHRRSQSRGRVVAAGVAARRDRSRTRSRSRLNNAGARAKQSISIKARLGVRPGTLAGKSGGRNRRPQSVARHGVATGRVQKRRNPGAVLHQASGASRIAGRPRGRPAVGNDAVRRSRSRTRKGSVGQQRKPQPQQQLQQRGSGSLSGRGRRGRSQQLQGQRGGSQRNGNTNKRPNGQQQQPQLKKAQQQQRRGRSRSRGGVAGVGGRNLGKQPRGQVKREDLDQELDQYMATPKTDVDYLLKN